MWYFLPKESLSAETPSFGSFGILAEMFLFEVLSFGYRQKEEISLSVAHYNLYPGYRGIQF